MTGSLRIARPRPDAQAGPIVLWIAPEGAILF